MDNFGQQQPYYNPNQYAQPGQSNVDYYSQRLRQLENQRNQIMQQQNQQPYYNQQQMIPAQTQQQPLQPQMICRPVTSKVEAEAAMIDGFNIYIFPDFANGFIHVKQMINDGTAPLKSFKMEGHQAPQKAVTLDDVVNGVNTKFQEYEERIAKLEGGLNNVPATDAAYVPINKRVKTGTKSETVPSTDGDE